MRTGFYCLFYLLVIDSSCQEYRREYSNDIFLLDADSNQEPIEQMPQTEIIRQKSGREIMLKCKTQECNHVRRKSSISWEFSPCKPCRKKEQLSWIKIESNRKCKLNLYNVSKEQNGLYRCNIDNVTINVYELDVIEYTNYEGEPPSILDIIISPNATIHQQANVVIQCKVYSIYKPEITWFKQADGYQKNNIEYQDKFYTRLNTSHNVYRAPYEEDVYVSKIILQNVTHWNSGVYVCVALTGEGKDLQSFTISVIPDKDFYQYPVSLSLLFLIPLPFVFIPIMVWLCYFKNKKVKKRPAREQVPICEFQDEMMFQM